MLELNGALVFWRRARHQEALNVKKGSHDRFEYIVTHCGKMISVVQSTAGRRAANAAGTFGRGS